MNINFRTTQSKVIGASVLALIGTILYFILGPGPHLIPIEQVADMQEKMLGRSALADIARTHGMGGFYDAKHFKRDSTMIGVMLWYCYNPHDPKDKLFMVVNQVETYDEENPDNNKPTSGGFRSIRPFHFPQTANRRDELVTEILNLVTRRDTPDLGEDVPKDMLMKYNNSFDSLMRKKKIELIKYPYAFFLFNPGYDSFMNHNPTYVRYYFSFSPDTKFEPNCFRPILGGADSDGRTIYRPIPEKRTLEDYLDDKSFLQNSWPPPPPTQKKD